MQLLHGLEYKYQTPLGGALDKKILQPFVLGPALSGRMQKPALVRPLDVPSLSRLTLTEQLSFRSSSSPTERRPMVTSYVASLPPSLRRPFTEGDAPFIFCQITRVIKDANSKLKRTRYGADAISIQIAQVGNDLEAQDFLASIDADRTIGDLVDCTSNFESESAEMEKKTGKP